MFFGVFDFLQKMNERIRLYYYDTSSQLVFVCFLEESEDTIKNHFEIIWLKKFLHLNSELYTCKANVRNIFKYSCNWEMNLTKISHEKYMIIGVNIKSWTNSYFITDKMKLLWAEYAVLRTGTGGFVAFIQLYKVAWLSIVQSNENILSAHLAPSLAGTLHYIKE